MSQNNFLNKKSPAEKSYYQMRCDFYNKFQNKIRPKILPFEKERKIKNVLSDFLFTFFILFGIFLVVSTIYMFKDIDNCAIQIGFAVFVFAFVIKRWIKKEFESKVKNIIMPIVCTCFGELYWDFENYYGNEYLIKDSCVIPSYDNVHYDDVFIGNHKNVRFEIIEAKYTKTEGTGKNRRTVTVFSGAILKVDMNKRFEGHTIIRSDTLFHFSPHQNLNHTELEDVVFEKKFDVFTDDEIEARYLITPSFMERLTKLKTAFYADKISCAFYREHLFIALSSIKDLFALCHLNRPIDDFRQYNILLEEIISIIKLIEYFKLNEKIGL